MQHWALLRGRERCVCRPPFLCAHPGTPRDTQRDSEAWKSRICWEQWLPSGTQMSLGHIKFSRNYLLLLPAYCLLLALARTYKGTVWISVFSPALESVFCFCLPKWIFSLQCKGLAQLQCGLGCKWWCIFWFWWCLKFLCKWQPVLVTRSEYSQRQGKSWNEQPCRSSVGSKDFLWSNAIHAKPSHPHYLWLLFSSGSQIEAWARDCTNSMPEIWP